MSYEIKTMADIAIKDNGIVDGPFGSNLKKCDYIDDKVNGVPVLTTKNLHGDYSDDSVRYISKEKYEQLERSTVFPGDILVAKIGSIGTCGIYPLTQRIAIIPANLLKITVLPSMDRKYVYYYIQSAGFQKRIKDISTATAQPAFNVSKFRKLPIPVPLLEEQQRIVARIEELFSQLDDAEATLQKTKVQLALYRQAVLTEAYKGNLTKDYREKLSLHRWQTVSITNLISRNKYALKAGPFGSALKKEVYVPSGYKIYGQEQVIAGDESIGEYYIDNIKYEELKAYAVAPGDILISLVGTVGKVLVLSEQCLPGIINPRLIKVSLNHEIMIPLFFKYYFESAYLKSLYKNKVHGATMDVLNMRMIKELDVIKQFHSIDEYNAFKMANLEPYMINKRIALIRTDIELTESNLQRMRIGLSPLDSTGNPFELHHVGQNANGTLAIFTKAEHDNPVLHGFKMISEIDRAEFKAIRMDFWKEMAEVLLKGGL